MSASTSSAELTEWLCLFELEAEEAKTAAKQKP